MRAAPAALGLACALACRAEAPSPRPTPAPRRGDGPVIVGLTAPPVSLDPHRANEFLTFSVLSNVCEGLVSLDAWLRAQGALAVSWTSPDDRHWRFELRRGVVFHDGRPLTADDVVFSLERARRHPKSQYGSYLVDVETVRAIDPQTVEITTSRPNPLLLNKLAFVLVVPRGAPDEIKAPVGTGPYSLSVREGGRAIVLRAFERHWESPPAQKEVQFVAVRGPGRSKKLLTGEVDVLMDLAPEEAGAVSGAAGFKVVAQPAPAIDVLFLRVDVPPFDDLRVRRAVDLAIDRQGIVGDTLRGFGRPASQLVSRNVFGFDPEIAMPQRDVAAARRLLAEAGHPQGLDLVLEHRLERSVAPIVRQLAEAGIRVQPVARHWHALLDRLEKGEVQLAYEGLVSDSGESSDIFLSTLHTRAPGQGFGDANDGGYSNAALDALIEEAARTSGLAARRRLLQRSMQMAMKDLSLIPLVERYLICGAREDLIWETRADGRVLARDLRRLPQ